MIIDLDLIAQMQFLSPGTVIEQNKLSEDKTQPAVWFQRRPSNQELLLNGSPGLADDNFDVEVYGLDIDAVEALADILRTGLHGFQGQMGLTNVCGMFVSDSEEDYTSKVEMSTDEGLNVSTFSVQILH